MRNLTSEDVRAVGHLARLELTDREVAALAEQLNLLLDQFEELQAIDTEGVPPTFHVLEIANVTREDETVPSLPVEDVIANAPAVDGPFFVVPRIVETD